MARTGETYRCESCGGEFADSPDWDREAEAEEIWGGIPDDAAVICDDCFKAFMPWMEENHPEAIHHSPNRKGQ